MTGPAASAEAPLDGFAYRHRVADVMTAPAITVARDATLREAAERLNGHRISALAVTDPDGALAGILSERDLVRCAARGVDLQATAVGDAMTGDVVTVGSDAFVYVAIGRMQRLGIRHLPVVDDGRLAGMISSRALMRLRSGQAMVIGDAIGAARAPADVAAALDQLPALAGGLLAEGCGGREIAAVISGAYRDASARAALWAEAKLAADGRGAAPAPYAYLILGSGGRGESLLRPDQDNAIVHGGSGTDDGWFAEFGRYAADFLNAAGVPYCQGHVMASEAPWRRSLDGWLIEIDRWIARAEGESLLNVDIFFDFQAVHGDRSLAGGLRDQALAAATKTPLFLRMLASQLDGLTPPLGLFGALRTDRTSGRFDAKIGGLLPVVSAARIIALATATSSTATPRRLQAAVDAGIAEAGAVDALIQAHDLVLRRLVDQQVKDRAGGKPATNWLAAKALNRGQRRALIDALRVIDGAKLIVRDVLTARAAV